MILILIYLVTVNVLSLLLMHSDKRRAENHRWRIPEATLILTAILGGSVGTLLGMYLFRHKTRHLRFKAGVPLILTLQVAIAFFGFVLYYFG